MKVAYKSLDFFGYSGYRVGNDGTVWSKKRGTWKQLVLIKRKKGYLWINLCRPGHWYPFAVHRLVLSAFVGLCPEGMEGCHNNGDTSDNRLENLRWDTRKNNHSDKLAHGTLERGEDHNRALLTNEEVLRIRKLVEQGEVQSTLAKKYGVHPTTLNAIVKRRNWRHL